MSCSAAPEGTCECVPQPCSTPCHTANPSLLSSCLPGSRKHKFLSIVITCGQWRMLALPRVLFFNHLWGMLVNQKLYQLRICKEFDQPSSWTFVGFVSILHFSPIFLFKSCMLSTCPVKGVITVCSRALSLSLRSHASSSRHAVSSA